MIEIFIAACLILAIWGLTERIARELIGIQTAIKEVATQIKLLREDLEV
jgi:hypothetical protein